MAHSRSRPGGAPRVAPSSVAVPAPAQAGTAERGRPIRLGIVGPGVIWRNSHRQVLSSLPDLFTVVAIAGRSDASHERARAAYPEARLYRHIDNLVDDGQVEAVVALTPIPDNAPTASRALDARLHAIVEKPIAVSGAEGRSLLERAETSGRTLFVLEQHAYTTRLQELRRAIVDGEVGEVVSYELAVHGRIAADESDLSNGCGLTPWRQDPEFPIGIFFDAGIHQLAALRLLFGPVARVYAAGRSLRPDFGSVDLIHVTIEHASGVIGGFAHSSVLGRQGDSWAIRGREAALWTSGEVIRRVHGATGAESVTPLVARDERMVMWEAAYAAMTTGASPPYTASDAVGDVEVMESIATSLTSGRAVEVQARAGDGDARATGMDRR